ncbi:hypothetical protein LTR95_006222 [Oleoguttula sp. CCFEE 5521]
MTFIKRITLFKVPKQSDIELVLKAYEILRSTAVKDGRPYVVSNVVRPVLNTSSPLSHGFTVMSQSVFGNHADHDFYDKDCPAHKKLKETTGKVRVGDVMTIVTEGEWPEAKL